MISGEKIRHRISKWLDEWKMAFSGAVLATRDKRFLIAFAIAFVVFGTLMNLLSGSSAALNLFWATDLGGKLSILGNAFLANFGFNRNFLDFLLTFFITILQSVLIGLVAFVWQKRRRNRKNLSGAVRNAGNVQDAGLAAGLAILGSGCPTCGTTLLAPLLSTLFSSSSFALASAISSLLTIAAVILALFAFKRIGRDAYVMILSERFSKRHSQKTSQASHQESTE